MLLFTLSLFTTAGAADLSHNTWFAGTKGGALVAIEDEAFTHIGGGIFGEYMPVRGFEIELSAQCLTTHHGKVFPIDFLAKGTFYLTPAFEPYAGLGPVILVPSDNHEPLQYGLALVAGSNFWTSDHFGVFIEPNVNIIWHHHHLFPEVGGFTGFIFGW